MSNFQWITLNNRLQQGISFINKLNNKKLELLLTHINNANSEEIFTETELKKLQDSLKLKENDLQLLIQSILYIYKHSKKVILKPTELHKQLIEILGFEQGKAEIFTKEWSENLKEELGEFENRFKFNNIKWELNLQLASDMGSNQALPNARIQLDLTNISNNEQIETKIIEMDENDLQQLYNNLEVIQLRLDNITKNSS